MAARQERIDAVDGGAGPEPRGPGPVALESMEQQGVWPPNPLVLEVNTWVWLADVGRRVGHRVTLDTVPEAEWDSLVVPGLQAVWFMGVWERSPQGREIALANEDLAAGFREALPDYGFDDVLGSAYCVRRYEVDERIGGAGGLARARRELARRGVRLILDFVPNHLAVDHPWVGEHPEFFLRGTEEELGREPLSFIRAGSGGVFANGRDPYFAAWHDVVQVDAFSPALRAAAAAALIDIAGQCDGVRCDMAMLLLSDAFVRTWGDRAGVRPETEYWHDVIGAVKAGYPRFLFLAEAYWGTEERLLGLGFDYCYDKPLYDHLREGDAREVRRRLRSTEAWGSRLVRFIENHDELRAACAFPAAQGRAAAVALLTLPGAALLYEGQLEGRRVRMPVFLARGSEELVCAETRAFYNTLLTLIERHGIRRGEWAYVPVEGWPDNQSSAALLAWWWRTADTSLEGAGYVVIVNYSPHPAQGRILLPAAAVTGRAWRLFDHMDGQEYVRSGDEMGGMGLFVDLGPWQSHLFSLERA